MKTIKGNLINLALEGEFDVIVHGCNCFNTMGSGIAKAIKQTFPEAYQVDLETIKGDKDKLGTIKAIKVDRDNIDLIVVNAYTQYNYSNREIRNVDYNAVRECFKNVKEHYSNKKIGYPMIGAGLGGGDWNIISDIIEQELDGEDHTLVIFEK